MASLFFVYAAQADALPHSPFGNSAAMGAVWLIMRIVQFDLSMAALVSLCLGTVSFEVIPRCLSSSCRPLLRNSPPQSACIWLTRRLMAASS